MALLKPQSSRDHSSLAAASLHHIITSDLDPSLFVIFGGVFAFRWDSRTYDRVVVTEAAGGEGERCNHLSASASPPLPSQVGLIHRLHHKN